MTCFTISLFLSVFCLTLTSLGWCSILKSTEMYDSSTSSLCHCRINAAALIDRNLALLMGAQPHRPSSEKPNFKHTRPAKPWERPQSSGRTSPEEWKSELYSAVSPIYEKWCLKGCVDFYECEISPWSNIFIWTLELSLSTKSPRWICEFFYQQFWLCVFLKCTVDYVKYR